jgi:PAS domain S-box-containing protein
MLDTEGKIQFCNDFLLELLERTREEVVGANWFKIAIPVENQNQVKEVFNKTINKGEFPEYFENEIVTKSGKKLMVGWNNTLSYDANGKILGPTSIGENITDRKSLEAERLKATRMETVGLLAGGIAHDFNNILTAILGNVTMTRTIAERHQLADIDQNMVDAEIAAIRARDLTKQLLTFSKGSTPAVEILDIGKLVMESVNFSLHGTSIKRELDIEPGLKSVAADGGQISQVINNLVVNAIQAMPQGGRIRCRIRNLQLDSESGGTLPPGDYVHIMLEDNGIGIRAGILDNIFDPYFTTKSTGSGLGLATSYSIIKNHEGHIAVKSQVGVGTTFDIYLPASDCEPVTTPETNETDIDKSLKILLMDDDNAVRTVAKKILESLGMEVTEALDGVQAIDLYEERFHGGEKFDLAIFDLTIRGGLGGVETLQQIRKIDPDVIAFVSSGYSSELDMDSYSRIGFKGAIPKPYTISEMKTALQTYLKQE